MQRRGGAGCWLGSRIGQAESRVVLMEFDYRVPALAKVSLNVGDGRTLKHDMHIMPVHRRFASAIFAQQRVIGMTFGIPAVPLAIAFRHHINAADEGPATIDHSGFLMMRRNWIVEQPLMAIVEQAAYTTRLQNLLDLLRASRKWQCIGIPEQNSDIDAFARGIAQHIDNAHLFAKLPEKQILIRQPPLPQPC